MFVLDDVQLRFSGSEVRILNNRFNTQPVVIHGNGPSKDYLNHLSNYISHGWNFADGCVSCKDNTYQLNDIKVVTNILLSLDRQYFKILFFKSSFSLI